jgi:uncharacterized glyoxalase superfamily protein PhnB
MKLYPSLSYRDARSAIDFLERAFGFELVSRHEDDQGRIVHAEMRWGDGMIMFGDARPDSEERWGSHTGQAWSYATCDDPDALFERAREAGAEVVSEPAHTDYGSRDFAVRDPEGNLWNWGTYEP